jgi:ubiquinone biosynthesis protein UbiJ
MISGILDWASSQLLGLDPEVQSELSQFAGKIIKIELVGPDLCIFCQPSHAGLQILSSSTASPDAIIRGTPMSLAMMGIHQKFSWVSKPLGVEIQGDAELVHELMLLMKKFRIDWEEMIAQVMGDRVAHQVGSSLRAAKDYGTDVAQRFQSSAVDYIQEEIRLLPPQEEVNDFMSDVDELRDRVERLLAQVAANTVRS